MIAGRMDPTGEVETLVAPQSTPPSSSAHPLTWKFDYAIYHAETRAQWRSWLEHHHQTERGVWLC